MSALHVPASILGDVLGEAAKAAPVVVSGITQALASRGYAIDLGPMTPDVARDFAAVDAKVDAILAAERAGADEVLARHDTAPAPPPESSR